MLNLANQPEISALDAWALARTLQGMAVNPDLPISRVTADLITRLFPVVGEYRHSIMRDAIGSKNMAKVAQANPNVPPSKEEPPLTLVNTAPRSHLILADDLHKLPVPQYALDEYPIYLNCLNALVGPSGAGKSFVAVDIAGLLALKGACVVYIAAEGLFGYAPRWEAYKSHKGVRECRNLVFHDEPVNFMDADSLEAFSNEIAMYHPALVIVDTVARCMAGGDENSTRDMGMFVGACDYLKNRLGTGLLVVHHTGKDGKMRGSTALFGACDSVLFLERSEAQVTVYNSLDQGGKNKYSEEGSPRTLQLVPREATVAGKLLSSAVLVETTRVILNPKDKATTNQRIILEALEGHENGLKVSQVIDATQIPSASVYRVLKELRARGLVTAVSDRYTITDEGKERLSDY